MKNQNQLKEYFNMFNKSYDLPLHVLDILDSLVSKSANMSAETALGFMKRLDSFTAEGMRAEFGKTLGTGKTATKILSNLRSIQGELKEVLDTKGGF